MDAYSTCPGSRMMMLTFGSASRARDADPNVNIIIREPGHVEYASSLGLGVYDLAKIKVQDVTV